MSVWYMLC